METYRPPEVPVSDPMPTYSEAVSLTDPDPRCPAVESGRESTGSSNDTSDPSISEPAKDHVPQLAEQKTSQMSAKSIVSSNPSPPEGIQPPQPGDPKPPHRWNPWAVENRKIYSMCALVTIPMIAFTATILCLIFSNRMTPDTCPHDTLCLNNGTMSFNDSNTQAYYYVDFPASRLVFIASWASSVSFTLVAALMAIYSYGAARQFLRLTDGKKSRNLHPTPFQTSMLFRILNADLVALVELLCGKVKEIFWDSKGHGGTKYYNGKSPDLVRLSVTFFITGILGR